MENKRIEELKKNEELLYNCIGYILEHIESYSETLEVFKRLGFNEEELLKFEIRDIDLEYHDLKLIDENEYKRLRKVYEELWKN